jgi:hypothetical protein
MEELHWCEQGRRSFDPVRQDAKKMTSVNVAFWRRKGRGGEEGEARPALTGGKGGTTPHPGWVMSWLGSLSSAGLGHHTTSRGVARLAVARSAWRNWRRVVRWLLPWKDSTCS